MFLSNASVRRPIAMISLIIALTLLGINAYRKMGLELMPKLDIPYISIITIYPGATPQEIETDVAKRIEDAVVTIDGLKHVTSSCMENACQTLLEFELDTDVDIAATDVREKLDLIRSDFPLDVEDPKIQKFDVNAQPVATFALTGDAALDEMYDYADNTLKDRITTLPGVAAVDLVGGAAREVTVELNREALAARGLSATDVIQSIQVRTGMIPSGRIKDGGSEYAVKFDADFIDERSIGEIEIKTEAGRRCRISDVGSARMSTEELRQLSFVDGRPCIAIKVIKKADANAVKVVNQVRSAMGSLEAQLPGGMTLVWISDEGRFIEATNQSAWSDVLKGIVLTAVILFLFLHNLRALVVVSITMPLTILIGLFFLMLMGYTLNMSTLIAIGMSVGILVTNSIVVLESIVKRLDITGDPKESSRLGASEAFNAVLASAGTNMVVLFPLAMMHSMIGRFIAPLALTMLVMTLVSLFISFTLTPLLCSLILKPAKDERGILRSFERIWNAGFDWVVARFKAVLDFNNRHRWAAVLLLLAVVGLFLHSLALAGHLGSKMVTEADKGELFVKVEYPTRQNILRTTERMQDIQKRLSDVPHLKHSLTSIGKVEGVIGKNSEGVHLAQVLLKFSERTERPMTINDLMTEVRRRLEGYPGAIITVQRTSVMGGQSTDIETEIAGGDLKTLDNLALKSQQLVAEMPGIVDPDTTVRAEKPEVRVRPKRAVLSDMGMTERQIGTMMRANIEGIEAGTFKQGARTYDIVVKLAEQDQKDSISAFHLPGEPGRPLPLATVGRIEEGTSPAQITRKDKRRISMLYANLSPELPLGTAVNQIGEAINEKAGLPAGYDVYFTGAYEKMKEGQGGFGEAGWLAIVLVFLSLAAMLESFRQPMLILVTIPLALIGAVWALALGGGSFGIFELMGMVMMIGIVVNNAILVVDHFNVLVREQGVQRHEAMIKATCGQFRPVIMITLAAVLGMMPLAFGKGIGAELRNGVGLASIGGILVSGILTLFVVPVLYDLITRRDKKTSQD